MLPLRSIICPTDFSELSREALQRAGELAAHFDAELCLLHVMQPLQPLMGLAPYAGVGAFDASSYEEAARAAAEQGLRALLEEYAGENVRVRSLLRQGYPADEIVGAAAREEADLIVIATHGRSGWRRHIFGSVTERVLRLAPCPVLVNPAREAIEEATAGTMGQPLLPLREIVCPTDFSAPSCAALKVAGEWATHFDARLWPLHVAPIVPLLEQPALMADRARLEESMQADAVQRLYRVVQEQWPEAGEVQPLVKKGHAADEIVAVAAQQNAGLIVIATHGAGAGRCPMCGTALEHILFGSVTANVLRQASCPVLTLRAPV
jgi:nucleotide-binding universal stress UspA family protein